MIRGTVKRTEDYISYFDVDIYPDEFHEKFDLLPFIDYSHDEEHSGPFFNFDGYLDVLAAPFYLPMLLSSTARQDKKKVKYFLHHFPNVDKFKAAINEHLESAYESMDFRMPLENFWDIVNDSLTDNSAKLKNLQGKLARIRTGSYHEHAQAASQIVSKLKKFNAACKMKLDLLDKEVHDTYNYVKRRSWSWSREPLAFFTNFFLADGYKDMISSYEKYDDFYHYEEDKENLSQFFDRNLMKEYGNSSMVIQENIKLLKPRERQNYIDKIKTQITTLHDVATKHEVKSIYTSPQRLFYYLIRSLEGSFPKNNWDVGFNKNVFHEPFIYRKKFLKKLKAAKLIDRDGDKIPLFAYDVSLDELESFVRGIWENVKKIDFNWKPFPSYFLLVQLKEHKAAFQLSKANYGKICIQGKPLDPDMNRLTSKKKIVSGKERLWTKQIEMLFK